MTTQDILSRLQGVRDGHGQWTARCPAHDDRQNSLSVGEGCDGRVLLRCHAGCAIGDIMSALGLNTRDLFVGDAEGALDRGSTIAAKKKGRAPVVATYSYCDDKGKLLAQKLRRADKSFTWRRPDDRHGWVYDRKGVPPRLYAPGGLTGAVLVCEGEKDVDTLCGLGYSAASGADGAGPGKWRKEYTKQLNGRNVCVFTDNDDVGRAYAIETCNALHGVASIVRLLDITTVWPDIPEHGDVSDMVAALGPERACELIAQLIGTVPEWTPQEVSTPEDPLFALFKPLEDFPEEEARWLVPGWIPAGQISVIAADGGIGKTTLWCHIIAALSNGVTCILDPPGFTREPMRIMFLTTEDSVRKKLRKKLRLAGANMQNIITPDLSGDRSGLLHKLKFGTQELEKVLRHFRPALCIFDPVQGFVPPRVNMGSRNEMRDCTAQLITIGEDIDTTALIVCHTNKRKGAYGRDRIADSADIWDISRSVMMAGYTEDQGIRYLSNEKNNYAPLQETILFSIDDNEQIHKEGASWRRDREYIMGAEQAKSSPMREDCKAFILKTLHEAGGAMPTADLDEKINKAGYSFTALRKAKQDLKKDGAVKYFQTGSPKDKVWNIQALVEPDGNNFEELPDDTETPFESTLLSDISKGVE